MATFAYEAINNQGKTIKAEIEATSKEEAVSKIKSQGFFPTSVKERAGAKPAAGGGSTTAKKRGGGFTIGGVSRKALTTFTRQLSVLQDAGLPVLRSLRILEAQQRAGLLKSTLGDVAADVEGGSTLSEAMSKHPRAFDRLYTNMVQAGEAGGVLETILNRLAEFMEKSEALKRKITGALIYPLVVIFFAVAIVTGIMIVVVPSFRKIFTDFKTALPAPTQFLLDTSNWFVGLNSDGSPGPIPFLGVIVVVFTPFFLFVAVKLTRQSLAGRYFLDSLVLRIPVFGQMVAKSTIARFTRTLGTLLNAGVPILEAIKITRDTTANEVYVRALNKAHDAIREGESFAAPLRQSGVVDPIVVNMIDVGEETGEIDKMLVKVADTFDEEVSTLVSSLVSLLEPIMVITLGLIVGGIVVALFMPLVTLISSVSGR